MSNSKSKKKKANSGQRQRLGLVLVLILGGALILTAVALALPGRNKPATPGYVPEVQGSPSLTVDKERVDFGDVKLGEVVKADFTVTNVGDQTLKFTEPPYVQLVDGC